MKVTKHLAATVSVEAGHIDTSRASRRRHLRADRQDCRRCRAAVGDVRRYIGPATSGPTSMTAYPQLVQRPPLCGALQPGARRCRHHAVHRLDGPEPQLRLLRPRGAGPAPERAAGRRLCRQAPRARAAGPVRLGPLRVRVRRKRCSTSRTTGAWRDLEVGYFLHLPVPRVHDGQRRQYTHGGIDFPINGLPGLPVECSGRITIRSSAFTTSNSGRARRSR